MKNLIKKSMSKMASTLAIIALLTIVVATSSCRKQYGCTQINALNYSPKADKDDGSCIYVLPGSGNNNGGGNNKPPYGTGLVPPTTLMVWTNGARQLEVWVGYVDSGKITSSRTQPPLCEGESGCFKTWKIQEGVTYTIEGSDAEYMWKQDIVMQKDCNTVLLDQTGTGKTDTYGPDVIVIRMHKKPAQTPGSTDSHARSHLPTPIKKLQPTG